jgi:ABC-type phosphate transport system substrate-binding protein
MRAIRATVLGLVALCAAAAHSQAPPAYRLVVHPRNPATSVDAKFLSDAFLKKVTRWPTGDVILPADLATDSPVRREFTETVLGRSVAAVRSYWQQLIFSGRDVPPPELESDAAVVQYVLKHRGALGYISGNADASAVKLITVK